ncbi:hypothetical protein CAURIM_10040 [Corynebacterium aurimucosum]|nr:hypothetical protein CAURIM_10040 [Corynebacterium aurimucosum]
MSLPNFDENVRELEEAFACFERVEEHVLDPNLLLSVK